MSERDRGDRPKKSWREMDAQRDRAGPRPARGEGGGNRGPNKDGMDARASKQYRAALDALFEKGEVGKFAEKLSGGPGASRIDPQDLVRGTHRGGSDSPAMSGAGSSSKGGSSPGNSPGNSPGGSAGGPSSSGGGDAPTRAPAAPTPAAAPPKEDGRAALRKKVIEALGRDEISRAIDRYVKAHGWPNDFEILEQALEHTKSDRQTEAMTHLEQLLAREKPKRSRTLAGKLRFIEETSDGDLRDQAARIRAKL
jgi:hypothetical protein